MALQAFTQKWFALYYPVLALLFLSSGVYLMIFGRAARNYLVNRAGSDQPPPFLRRLLKYFFLFTLPCLIFCFFPFSWPELLFSIWSLFMVYILGIQLVRWPQTRQSIQNHPEKLTSMIKIAGAIMLSVSPVIFLLSYFAIKPLVDS